MPSSLDNQIHKSGSELYSLAKRRSTYRWRMRLDRRIKDLLYYSGDGFHLPGNFQFCRVQHQSFRHEMATKWEMLNSTYHFKYSNSLFVVSIAVWLVIAAVSALAMVWTNQFYMNVAMAILMLTCGNAGNILSAVAADLFPTHFKYIELSLVDFIFWA